MFLTFPNVAITPGNRIDKLSENDLNLIRDTAIQNGGRKVQVQIRDSLYEVSNRPVEGDSNIFKVRAYRDISQARDIALTGNAIRLARQLNTGLNVSHGNFLNLSATSSSNNSQELAAHSSPGAPAIFDTSNKQQLVDKIDLCSFSPNVDELSCSEENLTCPVMLVVPEKGVFVKTSPESDICQLFDEIALIQLIIDGAVHPVSRTPLSLGMIINKNECYFDTTKG
ncbi:TPA: T3SS effector NleG family protein, partial [Salmonella enterica subsp. enterica serovar Enteritidis]|nr:T3SS effector NleG family protein [Salmonella enterica]HDI5329213.1 T3SS effector NleG family protein [Salmonella enterica]